MRVPVVALLNIEIHSVPLDAAGREEEPAFVAKVSPETPLAELGKIAGAGRFKLYGRGTDGTFLYTRYRRVAGIVASPKGAANPFGPIFETAGGMVAIGGLDPWPQTLLALLQQTTAMIREETAHHSAALVEIVKAVCARPDAEAVERAAPDLALLKQIHDANLEQLKTQAKLLDAERETSHKLALEKAQHKGSREEPLDKLVGKLADQVDTLMGFAAMKLAPSGSVKFDGGGAPKLLRAPAGSDAFEVALEAAKAALVGGMSPSDAVQQYIAKGLALRAAAGAGGLPADVYQRLIDCGMRATADPEGFARSLGWTPAAAAP